MPNSVIGIFNNVSGSKITVSRKENNMARKTHSLYTKQLVFNKAYSIGVKNIKADRHGRKIKFNKMGEKNHPMGWNIHHIDSNPDNNSISNLEPTNYITHKEIHDKR